MRMGFDYAEPVIAPPQIMPSIDFEALLARPRIDLEARSLRLSIERPLDRLVDNLEREARRLERQDLPERHADQLRRGISLLSDVVNEAIVAIDDRDPQAFRRAVGSRSRNREISRILAGHIEGGGEDFRDALAEAKRGFRTMIEK
jgi:hypothetical protein